MDARFSCLSLPQAPAENRLEFDRFRRYSFLAFKNSQNSRFMMLLPLPKLTTWSAFAALLVGGFLSNPVSAQDPVGDSARELLEKHKGSLVVVTIEGRLTTTTDGDPLLDGFWSSIRNMMMLGRSSPTAVELIAQRQKIETGMKVFMVIFLSIQIIETCDRYQSALNGSMLMILDFGFTNSCRAL